MKSWKLIGLFVVLMSSFALASASVVDQTSATHTNNTYTKTPTNILINFTCNCTIANLSTMVLEWSNQSSQRENLSGAQIVVANSSGAVTAGEPSQVYFRLSNIASRMSDGTHSFQFFINTTNDTVRVTNGSHVILIETSAPNVTINAPTASDYVQSNTTIPFNFVIGDTTIDTCWYNFTGTVTNTSNATLTSCNNRTFTDLTTGSYSITLGVNDSAGNINTANVGFTFRLSSSGGGGGGGGGGGSGGVLATGTNVISVPTGFLGPHVMKTITVSHQDIKVTSVEFFTLNNVNTDLEIRKLYTKPTYAVALPATYQYFEINHPGMSNADVTNTKVKFKVERSWLAKNGQAILYKWVDNTWVALQTTKAGEDAGNVYYSADTKGFSLFAIGAAATPSGGMASPTGGTAWTIPDAQQKIAVAGNAFPLWLIVVVVIVVVVVVWWKFLRRRRRGRR